MSGWIVLAFSCAPAGRPVVTAIPAASTLPAPSVFVSVATPGGPGLPEVEGWAIGRDGVSRSVGRTNFLGDLQVPAAIVANSSTLVFCHKEYFCGAAFVDESVRLAPGGAPVYLMLAHRVTRSVAGSPGAVSVTIGSGGGHQILAGVDVWRVDRDGLVHSVGRTDERGNIRIPLVSVAASSTLVFCHGFCAAVFVDDHLREGGELYLEIAPFAMM